MRVVNAYALDHRHSEQDGICDMHKNYVGSKRAVAKLLLKTDAGQVVATVSICRPCARALARNARLKSEA